MSLDIVGLGKIAESVCGLASSISNNITEWKIAKRNKETELALAMINILPQVIALPRDEREFFITSLYPQLLQYSNYHAFSKDTKDAILSSYAQIHPDIEAKNLEVNDDNFQQLYQLVDSHLAERRVEIKKLIEKCIIHIESGKALSIKTVKFIQELTDGDLAFLKKYVIPFIDMNLRVLVWSDKKNFEDVYTNLNVFSSFLSTNYSKPNNNHTYYHITLHSIPYFTISADKVEKLEVQKVHRHIYELATVCDPLPLSDDHRMILEKL